jgi:hypothetical protein
MTSNNTPSHEPGGQQGVEAVMWKATHAGLEHRYFLATPQPTERERIVAWLRDLPEDEWYPRHVADAIERGDYLASDPD